MCINTYIMNVDSKPMFYVLSKSIFFSTLYIYIKFLIYPETSISTIMCFCYIIIVTIICIFINKYRLNFSCLQY